jgi:hypothetical protein
MRFGESYDPADSLYDEVRDLDRQKDIEFKKWDEERRANNQRLQVGCMIAWFVVCGLAMGISVLVHWFSCSVLNWC